MRKLYHAPQKDDLFIADEVQHYGTLVEYEANKIPNGRHIRTGLYVSQVLPSIDFETYSAAGFEMRGGKIKGIGPQGKGGLGVVGTPAYAEHESTEILCLYYNLKDGAGVRAWVPGMPNPQDLLDYVQGGHLLEAFNVTFEFYIWNLVAVRLFGWPPLQLAQCRCAMAKARRHSLPASLANVSKVLGTAGKDKGGQNLIQKLCRPHTPTKNRQDIRWTPATAWDDFVALYRYCGQDTVAEDEVSARVPDLTGPELATWLTDQTINARGVQVDVDALDAALDILAQAEQRYTLELQQITSGVVSSISEVAKILAWLAGRGLALDNLQAETVTETLAKYSDNDSPEIRVLHIRSMLGAANVKKLRSLRLQVNRDGRLRDQYKYCGADRTGRWSAGGVQLQNMTANGPEYCACPSCGGLFGVNGLAAKAEACPRCGTYIMREGMAEACREWDADGMKAAISDVMLRDLDNMLNIWGDPIAALCGILRGLFISAPGKDLICADYSAIEAVVLACLSRCQWRIDVFNGHGKIYEMSAAKITGRTIEEYADHKARTGTHHPDRKKVGKVAELASGYGGWLGAWRQFGAEGTDEEVKAQIIAWREASPEIVEFWGGQHRQVGAKPWDSVPELYGLEGMAVRAILEPGQWFSHIDISYGVYQDVLYCRLPSGRFLHYHRPKITPSTDHFRRPCYKITFEGYNSNSAKGPVGWHVLETYGGRLAENVTQAVAADIQADGLKNLEGRGYPVVMHTHDEATTEVPEGLGSVQDVESIMAIRPDWAAWYPIKAAGWRDKRYQKD